MKDALKLFAERFAPPGLTSGGAVCIPSLTGAADAFLALTLTKGTRLALAITPGIPDAERLADDLRLLATESRILEFPPSVSGDRSALGVRLKTIAALRAWAMNPYPCVVVVAYPALALPIPRAETPGLQLVGTPFTTLCERLAEAGYHRTVQVAEEGDYSVRGGIVDAWSPGDEFPVRAEFFGEELESVRRFNAATQISIERIDDALLLPIGEGRGEGEGEGVGEGEGEGEARTCSLIDLLPDQASILALEHNEYNLFDIRRRLRDSCPVVYTGNPAPAGVPDYAFQTAALPGFAELGADEAHHPELFDAARQRLEQHIAAAERRGDRILRLDGLSGGFELPGLLVVTKADRVFSKRKTRFTRNSGGGQGLRTEDIDELEPGEYVVHVDHGVGRYIGSSQIKTGDKLSEVFTIEYADGAKLHVPVAHAHLLSRYVGVKGEAVRLHRLDGKRWSKDKADAQKSICDLAAALLETQARRETVPGFAYDVHCDGIDAFEAAFPYEETPDQLAAIAAVKADLAKTKPMDRLICGDAGYGKTEVAMRAAFIAAMNGKQVAVLAPTTVLAEQHFETFTSRFDGTPIRIESMSRFQTAGTHNGTFNRLATGVCDIVIGTHAILSKKACFHDLGLIIIDEEQRFGVRHKEFLKRLRATADVLTLSATPIPRTLYLSMTGARDLSLLRTPPRERVAVDTKIVTDSDEIVKAAIESELERGGQVFFLHNRVATIGKVEKRLKEIFSSPARHPSLDARHSATPRIVVAHGQMDSLTLAQKMRDFERGAYDILLSTTIVESGIDIPRANTILIDHAEMFGLADLYQLRGRVGRSSREGHAVFLLPTGGLVDSDARERLQALRRHGGLGGGFDLAVRDLELRGAGNLLGSQQSGHIAAIGFSLYCQLLQRTIARIKGEKVREIIDVKLNLDFANQQLPFEYIEEDVLRLSLMRRFAVAQDERAVRALAKEMRDRFGPPPPAAEEFVKIALLRVACAAARIGFVDAHGTRAVLHYADTREIAKVVTLGGDTFKRKMSELMSAIKSVRQPTTSSSLG